MHDKNIAEIMKRKLSRSMQVESVGEGDSREITFSYSSELPVERWFGREILSHDQGAMDLSRMNGGANVLFNHDPDQYVGVVTKSWLGPDKRLHATVRYGTSPQADQVFKDIKDGILKNVSFGYQIENMVLSKSSNDGQDEYTATKWFPFEVSNVTIPADSTVGIGRSQGADDSGLKEAVTRAKEKFEATLKVEQEKTASENAQTGERMESTVDVKAERAQAIKEEKQRSAAITALCEKHEMHDLARTLIDGDKSLDEARSIVLEKISARGASQKPASAPNEKAAEIGLTEKEKRQFSFLKAMRAQLNPNDRGAQEDAAFEREVSRATEQKSGKSARGIMVPFDVLREKRDLVAGTATAGGNLIDTQLLMGSFIDILRNKSILNQAGATMLTGLQGPIEIPRQTGAASAYWVAEAGAPTASQQAFDQVAMTPHTVAAKTQFTRRLMLQTSMDVEAMVRGDLAAVIALEIDRAGLYGSGAAGQPLGLKGQAGLNAETFAGATPTFGEMVAMETAVNSANADIGVMKYLLSAAGNGALKTAPKVANQPIYILDNGQVNGYDALRSNQVVTGDYWFGVWNQLLMGMWSGLDIQVDPYSLSDSGGVKVVCFQDLDIAVRHAQAFTLGHS